MTYIFSIYTRIYYLLFIIIILVLSPNRFNKEKTIENVKNNLSVMSANNVMKFRSRNLGDNVQVETRVLIIIVVGWIRNEMQIFL